MNGGKVSQASVNYRRGLERQCGRCTMYRKSDAGTFGSCTHVSGQITTYGVCDDHAWLPSPFGRLSQQQRIAIHSHRLNKALAGHPPHAQLISRAKARAAY